jgi:hypothetical protein
MAYIVPTFGGLAYGGYDGFLGGLVGGDETDSGDDMDSNKGSNDDMDSNKGSNDDMDSNKGNNDDMDSNKGKKAHTNAKDKAGKKASKENDDNPLLNGSLENEHVETNLDGMIENIPDTNTIKNDNQNEGNNELSPVSRGDMDDVSRSGTPSLNSDEDSNDKIQGGKESDDESDAESNILDTESESDAESNILDTKSESDAESNILHTKSDSDEERGNILDTKSDSDEEKAEPKLNKGLLALNDVDDKPKSRPNNLPEEVNDESVKKEKIKDIPAPPSDLITDENTKLCKPMKDDAPPSKSTKSTKSHKSPKSPTSTKSPKSTKHAKVKKGGGNGKNNLNKALHAYLNTITT